MRTNRKSWFVTTAGMAGLALVLSSCGGGDSTDDGTGGGDDATAGGGGDVTLTVATFNEFGYEDLITEYMELNPGITVEQKKAATSKRPATT